MREGMMSELAGLISKLQTWVIERTQKQDHQLEALKAEVNELKTQVAKLQNGLKCEGCGALFADSLTLRSHNCPFAYPVGFRL